MKHLLLILALLLPGLARAAPQPSVGMNLNGIADWSPALPFIDQMHSARPWIGHLEGQWGGFPFAQLLAEGWLDAEGWPRAIPPGVVKLETFVLTDLPEGAASSAGHYLVTWDGAGSVTIGGSARNVRIDRMGRGIGSFDFAPGSGPVGLAITATDADNPIRHIEVVRDDLMPLHRLGALYDPEFIQLVGQFRTLRFMDWMQTNGSPVTRIADMPRPGDFSWAWRGVPVEAMVRLANEAGVDPWFTLPHLASDPTVTAFATYVRDHLDPRRVAYAEYSNEMWNFIFEQAQWAAEQARQRWGQEGDAWMQFAGMRAAQVADIWARVYGDAAPARLVRVVATHTGWPGLEAALLEAPLSVAEGNPPPHESFDAYAVTGYFGLELGDQAHAEAVRGWAATNDFDAAAAALRAGSFTELLTELWPYQAEVARRYGYTLLVYEGGTHVTGLGVVTEDEAITGFFNAFNYSPQMGALYDEMFAAWAALGAGPFMHFVDVAMPSKWGSWGALRWREDDSPRWQALLAANAAGTGAPRPEGSFDTGLYLVGTEAGEALTGSDEEDFILAGGGDDTIKSGRGPDMIDGGAGRDVLILPGRLADWQISREGRVLVLDGPGGQTRATGIERLRFGSGDERDPPPAP